LRRRSTIITFSALSFALAEALRAIGGARTRAFDRLGLDVTPDDSQEELRRGAEHLAVRKIEVRGERRGIDLAELEIGGPRIAVRSRFEALREVYLIAVADADVLLHAPERLGVLVAAEARARAREHAKQRRGLRRAAREPLEKTRPLLERARISPHADEPRAALLVVDHDGPIVDADRELGHVDVRGRDARQPFEPPAEVVAEIADRAAAERQVGGGRAALAELLAQQRERRAR